MYEKVLFMVIITRQLSFVNAQIGGGSDLVLFREAGLSIDLIYVRIHIVRILESASLHTHTGLLTSRYSRLPSLTKSHLNLTGRDYT